MKFDGNEIKRYNESKQEIKVKAKQIKLKTVCICNELYYDWKNRPKGVCVPVLDENFNVKKCKDLY